MESFMSPFIFLDIYILAKIGTKLYNYIDMRLDGISLKTLFKNYRNYRILKRDIYKFKYKQLHDNAFKYYLSLCINNSIELAYDLASRDMQRVAKQKRVNQLYDKLCKTEIEV